MDFGASGLWTPRTLDYGRSAEHHTIEATEGSGQKGMAKALKQLSTLDNSTEHLARVSVVL